MNVLKAKIMTDKPKKTTLAETDIKSGRGMGRRAFLLGTFGGSTLLAGCVVANTGITDSDRGANADPAGNGRGGTRPGGITDSDSGRYADPVGRGRGGRTGITDSDGGAYADPAGRGRGGRSGITDSDVGPGSDPVGRGRGRRQCTDSDVGGNSDPVGRGRRC